MTGQPLIVFKATGEVRRAKPGEVLARYLRPDLFRKGETR